MSFCPLRYHLNYKLRFSLSLSLYSSVISLISRNSPKIMVVTPVIQSKFIHSKKTRNILYESKYYTHNATSRVVEVLGLIMGWLITLFYYVYEKTNRRFYRRRFEITDTFFICFYESIRFKFFFSFRQLNFSTFSHFFNFFFSFFSIFFLFEKRLRLRYIFYNGKFDAP